ncbi:MAG: V-type ATPase subunit, partial [Phycisphaerae bacterium]|nr:V-type ATPase subunit [Phycisphaerae bacterium]
MAALWTGEFREDWRYAFAIGALRVLQTRLLESSRLNDLANSISLDEMVARLAGTAYAPGTEGSAVSEQIEARLKHLRWAAYELIIPMCLDEALKRFLQGPEDFRNLKILLRRTLIENSPELPLSDLGFIKPDQLQQDFEAEKYDSFEPAMAQTIQDAIVAYYDDKNPRNIDFAVDRGAIMYRRTLAGELKNEYLLGLCALLGDLGNIRSMARLKWLEEDSKLLGRAFLPGGSIELSRLQGALAGSWEAISAMFFATPYAQLIEHG